MRTRLSRNLVLGPRAAIDTKPELEIFADDVKCSHGATVGDLDEAALFYLRARGIPDEEARRMLIEAFAREPVEASSISGAARAPAVAAAPAARRSWRNEMQPASLRSAPIRYRAGSTRASSGAIFRSSRTIPAWFSSIPAPARKSRARHRPASSDFYRTDYANVHRGVYRLSQRSTELFEEAREKVRAFLNAADTREIVFVRGATEAINLVAQSWGATFLKAGDEVLISDIEHHSNIVPWQMLRDGSGIRLVVAPIDADRRTGPGRVRGAAVARAPGLSR